LYHVSQGRKEWDEHCFIPFYHLGGGENLKVGTGEGGTVMWNGAFVDSFPVRRKKGDVKSDEYYCPKNKEREREKRRARNWSAELANSDERKKKSRGLSPLCR